MVEREFQIKPLHSCVLFLLREHGVIAGDYIPQSYTSCISFKNICFFGDSSSHCTKKSNFVLDILYHVIDNRMRNVVSLKLEFDASVSPIQAHRRSNSRIDRFWRSRRNPNAIRTNA